jgi:hypothetical protein
MSNGIIRAAVAESIVEDIEICPVLNNGGDDMGGDCDGPCREMESKFHFAEV